MVSATSEVSSVFAYHFSASIVLKTFQQIKKNETTLLFKSYNAQYEDGEQKRDFIYVKDCIKVLMWFLEKDNISAVFELCSDKVRLQDFSIDSESCECIN